MLTRPFFGRVHGACQRTNQTAVVGISPRALELLGVGLIALVLLGLFGRLAADGLIAHQRDTRAFYYPLTAWFAQELDAGRLPLWCPLIFGGYPLLADGEIGMLYPANVMALLILPTERAFQFVAAIHYFVAGAGSYALARVLGVGRLAATYAGIAFALCGFMIGHFDHGNILRSAAWLPVLLCCGELALRAHGYRVIRWTALAAASLGLSGLGLHPQVVLINLVTLWSYLSMRAVALLLPLDQAGGVRGMQALLSRLIAILACTTALGLAGAAAQLIPTYELGML
jgi:hypothetical protein